MSKLHLYHISYFDPVLKGLRSNGVSIEKLNQQTYIKRFDLNNPNTYLPLEVSYEFINQVKQTQGINCISSEFMVGFKYKTLATLANCFQSVPT